MFTHMLILKTEPYYTYATSEQDVLEVAKGHMDSDIVGVIVAPEGLSLMEIQKSPTLQPKSVPQITQYVNVNDTIEEVPADEPLPSELQKIIDTD